ncbi:MAG: class I tRNA ligase family protein [Candidatus Shikimatogenerans sp. JK-2022]|nr:class I tRNA ligase family protein [Candidatus Shikimatogenerans bostrichidophilus]
MKYNYKIIEKKWSKKHKKFNFFKINKYSKKKFYILNMFPYPSGYGLHIGHSIGYIFSDILSKYKSSLGYNILNPIGFDSFGLPAEQYAINTGNSPIKIIKKSIKKYSKQLKLLGVFFNWDKIINTCNSKYYKWTQWIFIKLFNSYYDKKFNKARNIKYIKYKIKNKNKYKINKILNKYRLAYLKKSYVNWCPKLKSVLANDEVINGKSIRGGYLVIKKKMLQWHLRITKYIDRLLKDYKYINWPNYIKNSQIKWIGKKESYYFNFIIYKKKYKIFIKKKSKNIKNIIFKYPSNYIDILLSKIKKKYKKKILKFINICNINLIKYKIYLKIKNNLNKKIKIFISNFFNDKYYINNAYINNNNYNKFNLKKNNIIIKYKNKIYFKFLFKKKYIYNLKDLVFSRQRYWGEPIPIYYKNNIPINIKSKYLPLKLPLIKKENFIKKKFKLNKCKKWAWDEKNNVVTYNKYINNYNKIYPLDINTMPSSAGSNWYYLRYINPKYKKFLINYKKLKYWKYVDLYIGGIEHTNGHLLYSRFCYKFLKDINVVKYLEPYKRFINQGTILNYTYSIFIYNSNIISYDNIYKYKFNKLQEIYISKKYIKYNNILNIKKIKYLYKKYNFIKNKNNNIICKKRIEKMSKSKNNIITPDEIIKKYGIDCFRLYIIFMGPFNKKKIWNIEKIKGIKRFLNKIWNYYLINTNNKINIKYKKILNKHIYNIYLNYNKFLLHKNISIFMQIFNFLIKKKIYNLKYKKRILILLSHYIPYITEELWNLLGEKKSIFYKKLKFIKNYIDKKIKYIIMINNKIKDIIFINEKNNNIYYIKNIIKKKYYYLKYKNYKKKYIFINKKILNILI